MPETFAPPAIPAQPYTVIPAQAEIQCHNPGSRTARPFALRETHPPPRHSARNTPHTLSFCAKRSVVAESSSRSPKAATFNHRVVVPLPRHSRERRNPAKPPPHRQPAQSRNDSPWSFCAGPALREVAGSQHPPSSPRKRESSNTCKVLYRVLLWLKPFL